MTSLGIDTISVFGMPPVDYVHMTADLGCQRIGVFPYPLGDTNPHNYPPFDLIGDKALRAELKAVMADRGVTIGGAEGFFPIPGQDIGDKAAGLEAMADLGVKSLTTISLDPDRSRTFDQWAMLAEMAGKAGMRVLIEPMAHISAFTLPVALEAIQHIGRPNVQLMLDALHLVRAGLTAADVGRIDPKLIGAFQICDGKIEAPLDHYLMEAGVERMTPGQGDFPLAAIIASLPRDIDYSLEIPQLSLASAGVGPFERLKPCVDAAKALLEEKMQHERA